MRTLTRKFLVLVIAMLVPLLSGCSVLEAMVKGSVSRKLDIRVPDFSAIMTCMKEPQGLCASCERGINRMDQQVSRPAIPLSSGLLDSDEKRFRSVQDKMLVLYAHLSGLADYQEDVLQFSDEELNGYSRFVAEGLHTAPAGLLSGVELTQLTTASDKKLVMTLFEGYFTAYMRGGEFAKIEVNMSELKKQLIAKLREKIPGIPIPEEDSEEFIELLKKHFPELASLLDTKGETGFTFGKVKDVKFVTREGDSYQFPPLSVSLTPGGDKPVSVQEIDLSNVGADLIRVTGEAVGDAVFGLPGVPTATGTTLDYPGGPGGKALTVFDSNNYTFGEGNVCITDEDFSTVHTVANTLEGTTSTAFGQLIRGVSLFSLNNEALAKLLETLVGVVVRKVTEKATWCTIACDRVANPEMTDSMSSFRVMGNLGGSPSKSVKSSLPMRSVTVKLTYGTRVD